MNLQNEIAYQPPQDSPPETPPKPSGKLLLLGLAGTSSIAVRLDADRVYLVGRALECDLIIDDLSVSRRHAELRQVETQLEIRDLGSRNGTFIDESRILVADATPGQKVGFGST